jgi:hypothetical protein
LTSKQLKWVLCDVAHVFFVFYVFIIAVVSYLISYMFIDIGIVTVSALRAGYWLAAWPALLGCFLSER